MTENCTICGIATIQLFGDGKRVHNATGWYDHEPEVAAVVDRLMEIRERVEAVTLGRWAWNNDESELMAVDDQSGQAASVLSIHVLHEAGAFFNGEIEDMVFIAHAPADMRYLLAEIDRLRGAR